MKKTCANCADQMVCIAYGKEQRENCDEWTISLSEYLKILEENKITDPNEMEKILNKIFK